jgi:polyphosphate glucokinase
MTKRRHVLVIDIGGTGIKVRASGRRRLKLPSGHRLTPKKMVKRVLHATEGWRYDAVSIGFPGPVRGGRPILEPRNLGRGWVGFDFERAFHRPVKVMNDAAMQALGGYHGGRMLFLGLGTGLGSALIVNGVVEPLELAHLPYKKGRTFEDYVGERGFRRLGKRKWRHTVKDVVDRLAAATRPDYVVIGGGNVDRLKKLPTHAVRGSNERAFAGGLSLWAQAGTTMPIDTRDHAPRHQSATWGAGRSVVVVKVD